MKDIHDWLEAYGESHQNRTNKIIHWICVPSIFFSILALLSLVEISPLEQILPQSLSNLATLVVLLALLFYMRLSFALFIGIALFVALCYWGIVLLNASHTKLTVSLTLFILAWIVQFIGHKIEGKKPSFLNDVKFLLIGPAWILSFIYKKLGIDY